MTTTTARRWRLDGRLGIRATGAVLPGRPVASDTLIALMEDRFGFTRGRDAAVLSNRLGIGHRHICRDFVNSNEDARAGDSNAALAAQAVVVALDRAGLKSNDLGYVIGHTATPESELPPNIALAADVLGYDGPFLELRQACTGFANALMIAAGLVASGNGPVAIVGSETGSLFLDPAMLDGETDQIVNLMQMGDGAGAVIVDSPSPGMATIDSAWFGSIGQNRAPAIWRASGARHFGQDFTGIRTSGHRLFEAGLLAAAAEGASPGTVDMIVPHQANGRIDALLAAHLGVDVAQIFVNADRIGNTGSAAIWIALDALRASMAPGARVLTLGAEASKSMYGGFVYTHG